MRKTNSFEIVTIGEFDSYSLTQKPLKFQAVTGEGIPIEQKREGTSTTIWIDETGKQYDSSMVFYDISGKKVQKIAKTEKVNKFNIVDKAEVIGDFMSDSYSILGCSETTLSNFDRIVGHDKAIFIPLFKCSSRGFKFEQAFIFKFQSEIVMLKGIGKISKGIEEYKKMKENSKTKKEVLKDVVEVKAEDLENELMNLI